MLEVERQYYDEHRQAWLEIYPGKTVLVKGRSLVGVFDTPDAALAEGARQFGVDSYLIRPVQDREPEVFVPALTFGVLGAPHSRPDKADNSRSE